jgi:hypothetical protein
MQEWAFVGANWAPTVGWGLGLGLKVRPPAHDGLGFGPEVRAQRWALRKSTYRSLVIFIAIVSFASFLISNRHERNI